MDTRKGASDRFVLGYRLASALETQDDAQRVLNDEDEKDKLLFLLVSHTSVLVLFRMICSSKSRS